MTDSLIKRVEKIILDCETSDGQQSGGFLTVNDLRKIKTTLERYEADSIMDDRGAEWERFKRKYTLASMRQHPNPYTRWGLSHSPRWLLVYEDADRGIALFDEREEALLQFAKSEQAGWNCTLFVTETRN